MWFRWVIRFKLYFVFKIFRYIIKLIVFFYLTIFSYDKLTCQHQLGFPCPLYGLNDLFLDLFIELFLTFFRLPCDVFLGILSCLTYSFANFATIYLLLWLLLKLLFSFLILLPVLSFFP